MPRKKKHQGSFGYDRNVRFALIACLVAGCGGASIPSPAVADDPGYPAGPYGYTPGQTLPDLLFDGKVVPPGELAEFAAWQTISLGSLRAADVRYFVIETAGAWCSDCAGDQPPMMQLESDYRPRGVLGLEILVEGALDAAPTPMNLEDWSRDQSASGTLLLDANRAFEHAAGIIAFPSYLIVDAATMQIVRRSNDPLVATPLGPILDTLLAG